MPISKHQLTLSELQDVVSLASSCKSKDKYTIPIYKSLLLQPRKLPGTLLYYHQQKLIGFLSVFFFYEEACELTLMVDPSYRKRGIANRLLATISPLLETGGVKFVYYAIPSGLHDTWLPSKGLIYQNTEYQMEWAKAKIKLLSEGGFQFHQAQNQTDIQNLIALDIACFHSKPEEMSSRFQQLVSDPDYTLILFSWNKNVIGKAHLQKQLDCIQLSNVAILPEYQNQGLGKILVNYCIQYSAKMNQLPLRLEVDSLNHNAVNLYLKTGFNIINSCDYWMGKES